MMIGIASDHGGYDLKMHILNGLADVSFKDLGTNSSDSVHYPYFADKCCKAILSGDIDSGILICGTGIGISMRANRYCGIRAALVHDEFTAKMSKAHNNSNILCLGGRTTSNELAIHLVQTWMDTPFESGRHQDRIELIDAPIQ